MVDDVLVAELHAASSELGRQRLALLSKQHASRYLTARHPDRANDLRDNDARIAIALRNGRPPLSVMPTYCGDCKRMITPDGEHLLRCRKVIARWGKRRHNDVATELGAMFVEAGGSAYVELSGLDLESRKTPDIDGIINGEQVLVDVRITDSLASSYDGDADRAFAAGCASKVIKYQSMAKALGARVIPFVMDAFGGFDKEAIELVSAIAREILPVASLTGNAFPLTGISSPIRFRMNESFQ